MRPILLKGHTRAITQIKYNHEGDLLFTCAKDDIPTLWYTSNGERVGTYNGHTGAVWSLDVNFTSTRLVTGGGDMFAKLWDVQSGRCVYTFNHRAPVRSVGFSLGDRMLLTATDRSMGQDAQVFLYNLAADPAEQSDEPVNILSGHTAKINTALWGPLNQTILTGSDDCTVRVWDVETGAQILEASDHKKPINDVQFSKDGTMFITASSDQTARLYDTRTCRCLKTYESDRPLNSAAISPYLNHVMLGGGQEAASVTTTATRSGKFEAWFYHIFFAEAVGSVKGHFGPINSLAFSPDGKSFATGAEDGYIRLHHFDNDMSKMLQSAEL